MKKNLQSREKEGLNVIWRLLQLLGDWNLLPDKHTVVIRTKNTQPVCECNGDDSWVLTTTEHAPIKTSSLGCNGSSAALLGLSSMQMALFHQSQWHAQDAKQLSGRIRHNVCAIRMAWFLHPHSLRIRF